MWAFPQAWFCYGQLFWEGGGEGAAFDEVNFLKTILYRDCLSRGLLSFRLLYESGVFY